MTRCIYYEQCEYAKPNSLACRFISFFCADRAFYEIEDREEQRERRQVEAERQKQIGGYYKK
jgi:hypothetical protein